MLRTVRQACILDCSVLTKSPANLLSEIILVDDYSDRGKNTVYTESEWKLTIAKEAIIDTSFVPC